MEATSPTTAAAEYSQVVLPERGMCLAVRKACPLLFSGHGIGGRSLLGDSVPRFLQCDIYAPVCRQVGAGFGSLNRWSKISLIFTLNQRSPALSDYVSSLVFLSGQFIQRAL